MMKVAVVTSYFPISTHPWNGHSAYQTLRLLAKMADVHVFYPETVYPKILKPSNSKPSFDPAWNPPGVAATYIRCPGLPVLSRPFNGMIEAHSLLPAVRAFAPDLVLNYMVYPDGWAAVRIAETLGVPAVLTAIGSDLNRPSDALCALLTRNTVRKADFVVTVSEHLRSTAVRMGAPTSRTRSILNGCDTSIFHPMERAAARERLGLDPAAEIVLYVGRLDVRKGLRELIEAMSQLRRQRPRAHCFLMGDGSDRPLLVESIAAHGAAKCVTLEPSHVTAQVAEWMAAADLVTLPSYAEGCPNVVIEALSAGRPVVAARVGGIPELMNDACGRLVPAREVAPLTHALDEVLSQRWDAEEIARTRSRSWQSVADDLLAVFEELVGRR